MEEIRTEMNKRGKENCSNNILDSIPDIRSALQRDAAAAYTHPEVQPRPPGALTTALRKVYAHPLAGAWSLRAPASHRHGLIPSTQLSHQSDRAEVDPITLNTEAPQGSARVEARTQIWVSWVPGLFFVLYFILPF